MTERRKMGAKKKTIVKKKKNKRCTKCNGKRRLDMHHIIRVSEGGSNDVENLSPLCKKCHREWHSYAEKIIDYHKWLKLPTLKILVQEFLTMIVEDEKLYNKMIKIK